jgi:putative molybdopterin biosynthesis protein
LQSERKVYRQLQSLESAFSIFWKSWQQKPTPTEEIPVDHSLGRILAEDISSAIDVPGFDRASMDGFAVIADDTFNTDEQNPVNLKVLAQVEAGDDSEHVVSKGEAIEVGTGAPIPKGANAVVMVEFTKRTADQVAIYKAVSPAENVTGAGSDIMCGEILLRKSQTITPREIGLMAAIGVEKIHVYRKPRVVIFSSGNELVRPGERLGFAKIYDINGPSLVAAIEECGGEPKFWGILPDDYSTIEKQLGLALDDSDIVMTSGSTSAGPGDQIYRAINELGSPGVLVHGLTLKPGKPAVVGLVGGKPVFGLPGYPTSALMIFHVLVAPVIRRLANAAELIPAKVEAVSPMKFFKARGRRELLPVQLITQPNGQLSAYPMQSGSGAVSSFAMADGFADLSENQEYVDEGERMEIQLFGRGVTPPTLVAIGSHCVGVDIAFTMLRENDRAFTGRIVNVGSMGGFHAVRRGEADMAGVHLQEEKTGEYNIPYVRAFGLEKSVILVRGYDREQGLIVNRGNPKNIRELADITKKGVRFINRNRGSGTRLLIDKHLTELAKSQGTDLDSLSKKIEGYGYEAKSHSAVAAAIKNDRADVGYGIRTAAVALGLDFIKKDDEKYDFLIPRARLEKTSVKAFIALLGSTQFSHALTDRAPGLVATDESGKVIFPR